MGTKRKRKDQDAVATAPAAKRPQIDKKSASVAAPTLPTAIEISPFVDNPRGPELKREVELYNSLTSEDGSERLAAANAIVSGILGGDGVEESTLQRHLERRLFRGLASGRKGARLGFSVVLTEILEQLFSAQSPLSEKYANLNFDTVLGFLVAKTKPEGDLSGQEEKDHSLGLLFGLQSFVRSKVLFLVEGRWDPILDKLIELSEKKPWIREECGWVVVEAVAQMTQIQAEHTLERLLNAGLASSPEGVGIWLTARNRFPAMKFPSKPWGRSGNPLQHLKTLAKALKESSSSNSTEDKTTQIKQTGNWNAQLHFVWNIVLAQYAQDSKDTESDNLHSFENFWKVAVDENLFSSTASRERKYWGFLLFQKMFQDPALYGNLLPVVFSHNLVRCLINHVQEKDRFLNRAADKSLKVMIQAAEADPQIVITILPRLIGGNGNYNFDKVTKTKTIDKLLSIVDNENIKSAIEILITPTLSVEGTDAAKEAELRRQLLGDYILNLVRRVNVQDDSNNISWIGEIAFPTVANVAYCEDAKFDPPVSRKTRALFRNRLLSMFAHLLSDLKAFSFSCDLARSIKPDAVPMDAEIVEAKDNALSTMEKLMKKVRKAGDQQKAPLQALALLYSLVIFQLYDGEPEAISILDELKLCYDKLIRHKSHDDSDVNASEVLVELLLSFISKPSALLRKVAQHVFSAFMTDMTAEGLQMMTDVLESGENLKGQQELFDKEPEEGQELAEDDEDELDSDVEVVDMNGEDIQLNGHLEDDDDESEDDAENDENEMVGDENDEEAQKLEEALASALGTHRLDQDKGAETESESDADMTDSEMMALDAKLVEIFSLRKKEPSKKQEQKDAKETIVNFKSRVLDLLEIYVKKQADNPLAFGLLLPLLQLMRTTKTKQLCEKAYNIILAYARAAKKLEVAGDVDPSAQLKLIKAIHSEASKDPSHMFARAASTASLLISSSLYKADKGTLKKVATVYRDSQIAWVDGQVKMQAVIFSDWVNWCQSHANSSS
ncbi:uncharacterized protein BP5553_10519 [Venustampulla echinocandica]|uniref:DNA polymerase V n=1 Tax=Venustampulla echinocandica TaxID=2656787 RepID=A0A370T8T0_9HELO|nr:uncharacterized protein BP5553_10519 [Venustampulla echinocandica]RDL29892.1 hypothetical protein BP5553_10519 [Venustampulla echinocandica]